MIGTALHIIGILLLLLLGLGLLLGLLLVCLPMRVQVRRHREGSPVRLRLSFGPLHVTKRLTGKTQKVQTTVKKQKKPRKQEAKRQAPRADWGRLELEDALRVALPMMDDLAGAFTVERLHASVVFHRPDAAQTGELLGAASALVGMLYPELARRFVLKDTKLSLDADFDAEKTVWSIDLSIVTRMIRYPRVLWRNARGLWNLWKIVRLSPEERKQWEQKQNEEEKE